MNLTQIQSKVQDWATIHRTVENWRKDDHRIVFTNGCFDLLHFGHLHLLANARELGDRLIVGLNSEESIRRLKGPFRPIQDNESRQFLLAGLSCVDAVVVFEEDTPLELIKWIKPDVLVKGGDWSIDQIIGAKEVMSWGGTVQSLPYLEGFSTSSIEEKIKNREHE